MDITHRLADKTLRITDASGNALSNKQIHVLQTKHKFLFGCGAFGTIPLTNADKNVEWYPKIQKEAEEWIRLFNYGTLPFYWGSYELEEGDYKEKELKNAAAYLRSKGVNVKGHPLCWHTVCADWLMKYDNETILKKQLDRIEREVTAFKGTIDIWDVINEVVIMPNFNKYDNAITRICKDMGRIKLVKEVFAKAKECNPNATLIINDFNTSAAYEILIDGCLEAGVPISAIGIQSHQHQGYWGEEKLMDILDRFSRFNLPIHFTENTLVSGDLIPEYIEDLNDWQVEEWPSSEEGEERQAKEVEEMYTILFSHPLVEAITTWDFKDGAWLGAPSGFLREDLSRKPSYDVLDRLINREWKTDKTVETDENGYVTFEAFKGDYLIECEDKKAEISITDNAEECIKLV